MPEADPKSLATLVLWSAFGLAALFGAIAQRTHFCTMGAVADIVNIGDWTRMRMWVMAISAGVWYVSGRLGHVAEDLNTLEEAFVASNPGRMESLSFVAPVAYTLDWLMFFSDASKRLTVGIVSVVVGSALYALATRSFRWEGFRDAGDTANHLVGAVVAVVSGPAHRARGVSR